MEIIDLSHTLDNECMTCGTPWHEKVKITQMGTIDFVGRNTHGIVLGSHSGTHIDAPLHFYNGADGVDRLDLKLVYGTCEVVDMSAKGKGCVVEKDDLIKMKITERMIFRFDWFKYWKSDDFYQGFPYFSLEAAKYLVDCGMKVIALDTPSPDCGDAIGKTDDSPVHKLFLSNGVTIIEYLTNTDCLKVGIEYKLVAFPLKIKDCDGSPARVVAIRGEEK